MEQAGFSIHQELWHEAWVAATASVRGRRKLVDFCVRQRVARLLADHGPETDQPLTLRVYGTLLKGFCVVSNERARALLGDCERVVLQFSQQPYAEDSRGLKLPPSKRQRVDAYTLDLDLSKVQESEAFDWTQAPLEDGTLMQLRVGCEPDLLLPLAEGASDEKAAAGSLLDHAPLLDEAFPPVAGTSAAAAGGAEEAGSASNAGVAAAAVPDAVALELEAAVTQALLAEGTADHVAAIAITAGSGDGPALPISDASGDQPSSAAEGAVVAAESASSAAIVRRLPRLPKPPVPGFVFGFDESPSLAQDTAERWSRAVEDITGPRFTPAEYAELMYGGTFPDHFGPLRAIFGHGGMQFGSRPRTATTALEDQAAAEEAAAGLWPSAPPPETSLAAPADAAAGAMPAEACGTLVADGCAARSSAAADGGQTAAGADPFRPYDVQEPKALSGDARADLARLLSGDIAAIDERSGGSGAARAKARGCDPLAVEVGRILGHAVEQAAAVGETKGEGTAALTVDDVVPPSSTERAVAARTFHALLTLATAGELRVQQEVAYGPIAILTKQ
eukprot:TRINITY_DN19983_c0_g5_i1.p1 TRINITY_DN19983_c0_g5~~TRINITY_DN19983_c0_g5_i1.p1  ORF type:complete len:621 (+),score=151.76 TRINITY_DN19983_c0_g5_i1:173-1864(+)